MLTIIQLLYLSVCITELWEHETTSGFINMPKSIYKSPGKNKYTGHVHLASEVLFNKLLVCRIRPLYSFVNTFLTSNIETKTSYTKHKVPVFKYCTCKTIFFSK